MDVSIQAKLKKLGVGLEPMGRPDEENAFYWAFSPDDELHIPKGAYFTRENPVNTTGRDALVYSGNTADVEALELFCKQHGIGFRYVQARGGDGDSLTIYRDDVVTVEPFDSGLGEIRQLMELTED